MNFQKEQIIGMHIDKIVNYSCYVDCLSRIMTDIIENGGLNLKPYDTPTTMELLNNFIARMHTCIINMKRDWDFYE